MIKKLCIFSSDPLQAYVKKGEIKKNYFNPNNFFDEIHVISFIEKDIEKEKVQNLAGNATLKIYSVGKINFFNKITKKNQILKIIKEIQPDVIRSYNSLIQGWIAAYCCKKLQIPFYLSLHVQYDGLRNMIKEKNLKKYLALQYSRKNIEPFVLKNADKITIVYKIIQPYVEELSNKIPEILYNRVDLKRFSKGERKITYDKPLILSVGRLTRQKNHIQLIKAIKDLDVLLIIIGDGELRNELYELIKKLNLEKKIILKKSVPNNEIQDYYNSADLFVLPYNPNIEGLPIPVLEAMASKLPIIIPHPITGLSDGLENAVSFTKIEPKSIEKEISKIINDHEYSNRLATNALKKSYEFDGEVSESREKEIYQELLMNQEKS